MAKSAKSKKTYQRLQQCKELNVFLAALPTLIQILKRGFGLLRQNYNYVLK